MFCPRLIKRPRGSWDVQHDLMSKNHLVTRVGKKNIKLFQLFVSSYLALLSDSPCDTAKPLALVIQFVKQLFNEDSRALISRYSSLADRILRSMDSTSDYTITGEFIDEMKDTPIFREYLHFFKTGDTQTLRFVLSFLYFGKKMHYEDNDLETTAFRSWLEIESDMEHFAPSRGVLAVMRKIIASYLGHFDDSVFLPKHGPGYTAEGFIDPMEKLDHLTLDAKSRYVFRPHSFGRSGVDRTALSNYMDRTDSRQVARLKFVPKNVKTMRSICMEPISRMFLQQEVARWLVDSMEQGALGRVVTLRDQSQNQKFAIAGSYTYSCDTIDLSSASDRLHSDLVRAIFPARWNFYLFGTRTNYVELPDERIVKLRKFAPMGSALCFPVQCIVFSAIVHLAAIMWHNGKCTVDDVTEDMVVIPFKKCFGNDDPEEVLPELLRPTVYGDDIICDTRITDNVLILLAHLGFSINAEKSYFGGSPFRESCGIFSYNGNDVSPMLFRVPSIQKVFDPSVLASLIDFGNRAGDYGYRNLHSLVINFMKAIRFGRHTLGDFLPFVNDRARFGLFSKSPRYVVTRENPDLQRTEVRVIGVRSKQKRYRETHCMESYAYDQWMRARIRGGSMDFNTSISRVRPHATRVELGWTPV